MPRKKSFSAFDTLVQGGRVLEKSASRERSRQRSNSRSNGKTACKPTEPVEELQNESPAFKIPTRRASPQEEVEMTPMGHGLLPFAIFPAERDDFLATSEGVAEVNAAALAE